MRVAYRGNFQPDLPPHMQPAWSTETHIAASLESLGHTVLRIQEDKVSWADTISICRDADLFLWTSTFGMAHSHDQRQAWAAVEKLNSMLPTAAFHLDKFWDLPREGQIFSEPWFRLRYIFTADGGNQDRFHDANINHHWSPPAVYAAECGLGSFNPRYRSPVAFVGNWRPDSYHPEWNHRQLLVGFLKRRFTHHTKLWPLRNQIRGLELRNLYASVKILVGDSCLVGGKGFYCSDRIPETLGRGGFLIHPRVKGVTDGGLFKEGKHLACWDLNNWGELTDTINHYLHHEDERFRIAQQGMQHVIANHTYANRMENLLHVIFTPGYVSPFSFAPMKTLAEVEQ